MQTIASFWTPDGSCYYTAPAAAANVVSCGDGGDKNRIDELLVDHALI